MPKVSEKESKAVAAAQRRVTPYSRPDAQCTLVLAEVLFKKNPDGTLDESAQTISNNWWDGTLVCHTGTKRPDIWVVKTDAEKGVEHMKGVKVIKYMLYSLKDLCKCKGYHTLTKILYETDADLGEEFEATLDYSVPAEAGSV